MIQLNGVYKDCYYITENGSIYNAETNKEVKPDRRKLYKLRTKDNEYKTVSIRTLYKNIFNKPYCVDEIEDLENELWKEIADTDGYYYVSNKGRIKSLRGYAAIILNPYVNHNGYSRVDIIECGKRQSKLVHKLVASGWLPMPERMDYQLHHKDFNKANNAAENLIYLSSAEHSKIHAERKKQNASPKPETNIH